MRIHEVRISGFRPIPFCANGDFETDPATIEWDEDAFCVAFPTGFRVVDRGEVDWGADRILLADLGEDQELCLLSAMIGANSSGKSSVLYALELFCSTSTKVGETLINNWGSQHSEGRRVIVEVTAVGVMGELDGWCRENCDCVLIEKEGAEEEGAEHLCRLTVARQWTTSSNSYNRHIRRSDGLYHRASRHDRGRYESLLPQYRLVAADSDLGAEISPGKSKSLMGDLFEQALERFRQGQDDSVVHQMEAHLDALTKILARDAEGEDVPGVDWSEIEQLEGLLANGLSAVNPNAEVKFGYRDCLPSVRDLFVGGEPIILDGIELSPSDHGLGMQRSFVVSTLGAWCEYVGHQEDTGDYFFAIEEPEMYLHPHAIRVMINTLESIAERDQVVFTTHSNEFANRVPLDHVTILRRHCAESCASRPDLSGIPRDELVKINRYMVEDRSDMLFARAVLLVEGQSEMFALPAFGRKLGDDVDKLGISIVCVNGKGNFHIYHDILEAFDIPHVILADGDGKRKQQENRLQDLMGSAELVYVLPQDFEYLIVTSIADDSRLLEIINTCRARRGKPALTAGSLADAFQLEAVNLKSSWWGDLREGLNHVIVKEHRGIYKQYTKNLQAILLQLAQEVEKNGHTAPTARAQRKALKLKKQGKPLLGRVLGDELTKDEIRTMKILVRALAKARDLASAT
jgi:hypothetical protein